ncbi:MAG: hypothetical protein U1F23_11080 [Lysobacterales bacterium]
MRKRKHSMPLTTIIVTVMAAAAGLGAAMVAPAVAAQVDIAGPPGSVQFGMRVAALPNGNFVVADPYGGTAGGGAVYLYSFDGTLISTLTGSQPGDDVGLSGIVLLDDSRFLVLSPAWSDGTTTGVGAVTWVDGNIGLDAAISSSNSLIGTHPADSVGAWGVTVLPNGNYVVVSPNWNDGTNVLVGAVTWGSGTTGISGAVSAANSLVGTDSTDDVGIGGVVALGNGTYVVVSPAWRSEDAFAVGAVTWGNGTFGTSGAVSAANSLMGTTGADQVGFGGVVALDNGNYVVVSPVWDNGSVTDAGAVTWGDGAGGTSGPISAGNSLVGTSDHDQIGSSGILALANGNYVVASPWWDNGSVPDAGAATWGNGSVGTSGVLSPLNSLVGTTAGDRVAASGVFALANGNYVVTSAWWDNAAVADAGAVTWADGGAGITGPVEAGNSLFGTSADDQVGLFGVAALANGNYVVDSPWWNNGGTAETGAVTWGNGAGGTTGAVSAANSFVGTVAEDQVGRNGVTPLDDGNYVVASNWWNNGTAGMAGAATWGNGAGGTVGPVSVSNSLTGTTAGDSVGSDGIVALPGGNYAVASSYWSNGAETGAGAVTWCRAGGVSTGQVGTDNSLVGVGAGERVGFPVLQRFADGNFMVKSSEWGSGGGTIDGAVTLASGRFRLASPVAAWNSVTGGIAGGGRSMSYAYDPVHHRLIVGRPAENIVSVFTMDQPFADSFDP